MSERIWALILASLALCAAATAGERGFGKEMDHGPFLSAAVSDVPAPHFRDIFPRPGTANIACKGIAIRLGAPNTAAVCFDADLLRTAFGWTGEYLNLDNTMLALTKGTLNPSVGGTLAFSTAMAPGWSADGSFRDPRAYPYGPLPKTEAHYKGLYLHGAKVILSYSVSDAAVLELHGLLNSAGKTVFTRTIRIEKSARPLVLRLCDVAKGQPVELQLDRMLGAGVDGTSATRAVVANAPRGSELRVREGRIELALPALTAPATFAVGIWNGAAAEFSEALVAPLVRETPPDLKALCAGGPPRWGAPVLTQGEVSPGTRDYELDTLTLPEQTPYKAWMRTSALDFFPDGRLAVCTLDGDVWIVSGIDAALKKLEWRRFATGLFEPLGLRVVDGTIYVLGRDQLTRLHDLNGDGEADFYENFNNDAVTSASYGGFAMDLVTDRAGNFYYGRSGHHGAAGLPHHGGIYKISKDGKKFETIATGMRVPNGLGMGPDDQLTFGDNQGNYVPASKISLVKPGAFYGFVMEPSAKKTPKQYDAPLLWLPMAMDSSSGSQLWARGGTWGALDGRMLHLSYGRAKLFAVLLDGATAANGVVGADGVGQGPNAAAAVPFPLVFQTGIMRGAFSPLDGQLYVCGVGGGWQAGAPRFGGIQRVRSTGKPCLMPTGFRVRPGGIELQFATALDPESAGSPDSYGAEQWQYQFSEKYGSPEFSVADPARKSRDEVPIASATLSADGTRVLLGIPGLKPVMQLRIQMKLKSAAGAGIDHDLYATIHRVPAN